MAAGRVDVPRRTDVGNLNWVDKNGYDYPSTRRNDGFNLGPRRCGLEDVMRVKSDLAPMLDDGVQQPAQKKRKFSPIVWDVEEKEVRISSRNGALDAVRAPLFANLVENSLPKSTVSDFSSVLSPLVGQQCEGDEQEQDMTGKEKRLGPNIFTSRWASDSDDEDDSRSKEKIRRSSSLESGEFEREELEGDGVLSNERSSSVLSAWKDEDMECKLESDGVMDIDGTFGEDASDDQSDSDVEELAGGMNMLLGCRSVYEYERLNKISEGTYGVVFRARDKKTGEIVALKKVKILDRRELEEFGFPLTSLREINILASFNHPSIVKVKEVVVDDHDNVYM
ncbi:hypothetical protein Gorai_020638, partial [Gossypium raimondii]|nr:hypothetical protein [Gossypium raimondii]